MSTLLEVKNLKTHFFGKNKVLPVVDGVDFEVKKGETLAIVGESGSGKSITSLSIMGLVPKPGGKIVDGQIIFDGTDLVSLSENEMFKVRGNEIAMIFQEPMSSLNPVLTIGEQITEVLIYHKKLSKKEARLKAVELLKIVGFARAEEILDDYPHRLSGGMRQRVMIAMAMSCDPKLLIADEPTTALDVTVQAQILELMKDLSEKFNSSIILITHDLGVVAELADRVIVMYAGQVVEESGIVEMFDNPLHPYTAGLLNSVPKIDEDQERLSSIGGNVPSPDNFPKGCRFATRCEHVMERCLEEQPMLKEIKPGRKSRCFLHEEGGNQ
ncbi:ABC transporter ATP-binding protein [Anaerobacillus isosaccharinicus]|uniref:ABC transporter ATP-binding protein n=1 Tax=Anaerobacillus isosaccharinicus TaxID=1532552 RepID=A0A1S2MFP9_9BACI|nr:ABC transporter ATP-binding protein [Anaerobacillus isosaccharinicus]MBA5584181.1 ABC transporter ATP-binding protein [Anaerobacillus isosaccharinicus]QOY37413.1 ABC transporter ATP-binding protein [Anaerobacillus isosaccharinicus]